MLPYIAKKDFQKWQIRDPELGRLSWIIQVGHNAITALLWEGAYGDLKQKTERNVMLETATDFEDGKGARSSGMQL